MFAKERKAAGLTYGDLCQVVDRKESALRVAVSRKSLSDKEKEALMAAIRNSGNDPGLNHEFVKAAVENYERLKENPAFQNLIRIERLEAREEVLRVKKLGANAKLRAGMSMDAIQVSLGHSDRRTTEIYVTKLRDAVDAEIMEKSPRFG